MSKIHYVRSLSILGCAVALASGGATVSAALFAYDPFAFGDPAVPANGEYTAGDDATGVNVLGGQNPTIGPTPFYAGGWIQSGGDAQAVKALPSLAYPSFQPGVGGIVQDAVQFSCCSFGRNGREIAGGLGSELVPRTIYESFLINFGSQGSDDPSSFGKRAHELWNGGIGDTFLTVDLFLNHFSGVNELSLSVNTAGTTATVPVSGGGLSLGALTGVHLVVMKYEFNPVNPDSVSVFMDPVNSVEPGLPDAQILVATSDLLITHHGAFTQFTFSGGTHIPGAIDEIRWGDTFRDVTPFAVPEVPPGAFLALSLAGLAIVQALRKAT